MFHFVLSDVDMFASFIYKNLNQSGQASQVDQFPPVIIPTISPMYEHQNLVLP